MRCHSLRLGKGGEQLVSNAYALSEWPTPKGSQCTIKAERTSPSNSFLPDDFDRRSRKSERAEHLSIVEKLTRQIWLDELLRHHD